MRCLGEKALAASRADRLRNTAHGLANSLRGMGSGAQPPLHGKLRDLRLPVRLLVGELDSKFRRIAADLADRLKQAVRKGSLTDQQARDKYEAAGGRTK